MNKKLFLPLAVSLMISSFSFGEILRYSFCDLRNNKLKSTLILDLSAKSLVFENTMLKSSRRIGNIRSASVPAFLGKISIGGIQETTVKSVMSYQGTDNGDNLQYTYYVVSYDNGDTGLFIESQGYPTFMGKALSCKR